MHPKTSVTIFKVLNNIENILNSSIPLEDKIKLITLKMREYWFYFYAKHTMYSLKKYKRIMNIPLQTNIINSKTWNFLIILDACRFDLFAENIYDYLDGHLIKAYSPASYTTQWLEKTWTRVYLDITYISATPYVNSFIPLCRFDPRKKFSEIIDAWKLYWDWKYCTVPPWKVNKLTMLILKVKGLRKAQKFQKRRFVIHYVQPHAPYLNERTPLFLPPYARYSEDSMLRKRGELGKGIPLPLMIIAYLYNMFKKKDYVDEILRKAYVSNLRTVLKYVADLITEIDGPIIITSDHGELLGEYGIYFHPFDIPLPELRIVPIFIVRS